MADMKWIAAFLEDFEKMRQDVSHLYPGEEPLVFDWTPQTKNSIEKEIVGLRFDETVGSLTDKLLTKKHTEKIEVEVEDGPDGPTGFLVLKKVIQVPESWNETVQRQYCRLNWSKAHPINDYQLQNRAMVLFQLASRNRINPTTGAYVPGTFGDF